jgi:hypothetical protein
MEFTTLESIATCMERRQTGFRLVTRFIAHFDTARDYTVH